MGSCLCLLHAWLGVVMEMGFRNVLSPVWSLEVSVPTVVHQQSPAAWPVFPPVNDHSLSAKHCFETWGGDNPMRRRLWQHTAPFQGRDDFLLIPPGSTSQFKGLPSKGDCGELVALSSPWRLNTWHSRAPACPVLPKELLKNVSKEYLGVECVALLVAA